MSRVTLKVPHGLALMVWYDTDLLEFDTVDFIDYLL